MAALGATADVVAAVTQVLFLDSRDLGLGPFAAPEGLLEKRQRQRGIARAMAGAVLSSGGVICMGVVGECRQLRSLFFHPRALSPKPCCYCKIFIFIGLIELQTLFRGVTTPVSGSYQPCVPPAAVALFPPQRRPAFDLPDPPTTHPEGPSPHTHTS